MMFESELAEKIGTAQIFLSVMYALLCSNVVIRLSSSSRMQYNHKPYLIIYIWKIMSIINEKSLFLKSLNNLQYFSK
jgi:hypothetical protein